MQHGVVINVVAGRSYPSTYSWSYSGWGSPIKVHLDQSQTTSYCMVKILGALVAKWTRVVGFGYGRYTPLANLSLCLQQQETPCAGNRNLCDATSSTDVGPDHNPKPSEASVTSECRCYLLNGEYGLVKS